MARISAYPVGTPAAGDYLVGSDITTTGTQINPTKNFVISAVVATGLGHISYASILTQAGAIAPTEVVLKNGTTASMTWARTGPGVYTCTASSAVFTAAKTVVFFNQGQVNAGVWNWVHTSTSVITLNTNGADGQITNGAFEIRIYT